VSHRDLTHLGLSGYGSCSLAERTYTGRATTNLQDSVCLVLVYVKLTYCPLCIKLSSLPCKR